MRIAYLINQYPKVSHSFIRREILSLEAQGVSVARYAIRTSQENLPDSEDQSEFEKTRAVLNENAFLILSDVIFKFLSNPSRFFRVLVQAIRIGWRSERGLLIHLAYFTEACVIARWCRQDKIDHLHAHFATNSALVGMLATRLGSASYSFTAHASEEFDQPRFVRLRETVKSAAFVVAVSSYGRSQICLWSPLRDWSKIKIVHCGLGQEFHSGPIENRFELPNLVCVGRFCEQKGFPVLIEAACALKDDGLEFELVLAGDGELRPRIEQMIAEYGLTDCVTITGWISSERVRGEIEKARALVLPSFSEGLPVVIMEAMALKRPVISTYIAGIPELVTPGENGWLVPAGDVDALAAAMKEALLASTEALQIMGEKARERVLQRHDINREAAKLKRYFAEAIEPPRTESKTHND